MANEQSNAKEVIGQAVAEVARVTLQAMGAARAERTQHGGPRLGRPIMKQPAFNCEEEDTYNELKNFRLKVKNTFKSYSMPQAEQKSIIKHWLGRKGLQFFRNIYTDRTRKM